MWAACPYIRHEPARYNTAFLSLFHTPRMSLICVCVCVCVKLRGKWKIPIVLCILYMAPPPAPHYKTALLSLAIIMYTAPCRADSSEAHRSNIRSYTHKRKHGTIWSIQYACTPSHIMYYLVSRFSCLTSHPLLLRISLMVLLLVNI